MCACLARLYKDSYTAEEWLPFSDEALNQLNGVQLDSLETQVLEYCDELKLHAKSERQAKEHYLELARISPAYLGITYKILYHYQLRTLKTEEKKEGVGVHA